MFPVLLLCSAANEFIGVTFTGRQVVESTTAFVECLFIHCETADMGGAVYLWNGSATLTIVQSDFQHCVSTTRAGAILVERARTFQMNGTAGLNCSTPADSDGYCSAYIISTSNGSFGLFDCSTALCHALRLHVLWMGCPDVESGSTTYVTGFNATANTCLNFASGLTLSRHYARVLRFATFSDHTVGMVVYFLLNLTRNEVQCVGFFNNSVAWQSRYPGMFNTESSLTMDHCVFCGNVGVHLGGYRVGEFHRLTLVRCFFDYNFTDNTPFLSLGTTQCLVASTSLPMDRDNCPWPDETATPAKSPTHSMTPTASKTPTHSMTPTPSDDFTAHVLPAGQIGRIIQMWYFAFTLVE
jgi:hypothetical protein